MSPGRPQLAMCYICGREFGSKSLSIHEPQCLQKWNVENDNLPKHQRRPQPQKPQGLPSLAGGHKTSFSYNEEAYKSAQSQLLSCNNCGRTFNPDRLPIHQRSCKSAKLSKSASDRPRTGTLDKPKVLNRTSKIDVGVNPFPTDLRSGSGHVRQHTFTMNKRPSPQVSPNGHPSPRKSARSGSRRPQFVVCYICGREFTTASLPIHEPQCLEKWKIQNSQLPRDQRRRLPQKPQALTGDGSYNLDDVNEVARQAAASQLIACKSCGRTFAPDRIGVHERICLKTGPKTPRGKRGPETEGGPVANSLQVNSQSEHEPKRKPVGRAREPKFVLCYICGQKFTDASLPIHEPQCMKKWEQMNENLPPEHRRKRPVKPEPLSANTNGSNRAALQEAQWQAAQSNLVSCGNCGRTFNPDRIAAHERVCKSSTSGGSRPVNNKNGAVLPKVNNEDPQLPKPVGMGLGSRGPSQNVGVKRGGGPPTVFCYICTRPFGTASIGIHEPKCLEKWHLANNKLPPQLRKPEPRKPDLTASQNKNMSMAEASWQAAQSNLTPCTNCGRTFLPDRLPVHQRSCRPK